MSHTAIVPDHATLRNYRLPHRLPLYFSKPVVAHIETYKAASAFPYRILPTTSEKKTFAS